MRYTSCFIIWFYFILSNGEIRHFLTLKHKDKTALPRNTKKCCPEENHHPNSLEPWPQITTLLFDFEKNKNNNSLTNEG